MSNAASRKAGGDANYGRAKLFAYRVLQENCVIEPPVNVEEIARNYVSDIEYVRFKPPYDAIAGYIDFERRAILINVEDSPQRRRFTIAHELGHLLMHWDIVQADPEKGIMMRSPIGGQKEVIEQEANCFAAQLLVPSTFSRPNMTVGEVARVFDVSNDMAGFRIKSLEFELK